MRKWYRMLNGETKLNLQHVLKQEKFIYGT
jgi:hypothetical protein